MDIFKLPFISNLFVKNLSTEVGSVVSTFFLLQFFIFTDKVTTKRFRVANPKN